MRQAFQVPPITWGLEDSAAPRQSRVARPLTRAECEPFAHRLWNRVRDRIAGQCWEWTGPVNKKGYANITLHVKPRHRHAYAHRMSWALLRGDLPARAFLCHSCDNPICVNPEHLWIGDARANNRDMADKGRVVSVLGHRDRCKNGHLFTPENTRQRKPKGAGRDCRTCHRTWHRNYMQRRLLAAQAGESR